MPRITPTLIATHPVPDHSRTERGRLEACPLRDSDCAAFVLTPRVPSSTRGQHAWLAHVTSPSASPPLIPCAIARARLRLFLLCLPCLFVQWRAPVPPAVAHLCHQLAHAMCRGWPTSRPHLPRRRRARRSARRPSPRSQRSSSRDFGELGAQLGAHRLEASGAPHEISASSALSSAPIASKPGSSSRDLTRSQRAMSRAAGSRAAAWLRCQR
jgi:hypothetical protein